MKYTFSGHESFPCKALWLQKGYAFIIKGRDFNAPDSVIELGVGKNMVSAIRYWLRAFGITRTIKPENWPLFFSMQKKERILMSKI